MRNRVLVSAVVAGLVSLLGALPLRAGVVAPTRLHTLMSRRLPTPAVISRHGLRRYSVGNAVGCDTDYPNSEQFFIGASDSEVPSFAGGSFSGVMTIFSNEACGANSAIGAGASNIIGNGASPTSSFIAGGQTNGISSDLSFIGAGDANGVSGADSFIGAGFYGSASATSSFVGAGGFEYFKENSSATPGTDNVAGATDSFVGAGDVNQITSSGNGSFIGAGGYTFALNHDPFFGNAIGGTDAFIGAGDQNYVGANNAFIGAGTLNATLASGNYSAVVAGFENTTSGADSFIGAGAQNTVAPSGNYSVVTGGYGNTMTGQKASLGGGEANKVAGSFATIPGGYHDEALGNESFAAGSQAEARFAGSFVWSDYSSSEKPQADSAINEFVARASGGVYFFSNAASSVGVHLASGSGTWSNLSDRNAKTNIVPLDDASILAKVASLPISTWQYKTEHGVRHAGPMAQDFYAAFGLGEDDRHITTIDEDGIALAAIKALRAQEQRKDIIIAAMRADDQREDRRKHADIAALRAELRRLEAIVAQRTP